MTSKRLTRASLWGSALGLAGSAFMCHSAMATTVDTCNSYNAVFTGTGYNGNAAFAAGINAAMGSTGALVLGVQATEYPGGALYAAISEPVCQVGILVSSNSNPAQSQINFVVMMPE